MKMLKTKYQKNRAFVLLDSLVIISLAGIISFASSFLIVSLGGARAEARTAFTKSSLVGLRPGITLCCAVPGNRLQANPASGGGDMCSSSVGTILPKATELGLDYGTVTYGVLNNCDDFNPTIIAKIDNHPKGEVCNGDWVISEALMVPPSGDC